MITQPFQRQMVMLKVRKAGLCAMVVGAVIATTYVLAYGYMYLVNPQFYFDIWLFSDNQPPGTCNYRHFLEMAFCWRLHCGRVIGHGTALFCGVGHRPFYGTKSRLLLLGDYS